MLTSMARRPPAYALCMHGRHHQPYYSKLNEDDDSNDDDDDDADDDDDEDDDDDNEEERDARRARSRILANKLYESLLHRSSSVSAKLSSSSSSALTAADKENFIEQRIKTAIDIGDIDTLKEIFTRSPPTISIEHRLKPGGWTPLMHAAYACQSSIVSLFVLEFGADINSQSLEQITPLMACCMSFRSKCSTTNGINEQLSICRFLLEHGAKIEPTSDTGDENQMTPLMLAARFGCSSILIHLLVEYGANIDRCDLKGWCPLIMATQHGHIDSVKALIDCGANPTSKTSNGLSALDIARHLKYDAIVQYLEEQIQSMRTYSLSTLSCDNQGEVVQNEHVSNETILFEEVSIGVDNTVNNSTDTQWNEQLWKLAIYMGVAAAIGGTFLFSVMHTKQR